MIHTPNYRKQDKLLLSTRELGANLGAAVKCKKYFINKFNILY